ncbi:MAG: histidine kinase [Gammaproteobacteria bacterium]|nr:histidine kinase [Gammaproteobacteria bacterium]
MNPMNPNPPPGKDRPELFLPDFCNIRIVFAVIVIAELLAFIVTLASPAGRGGGWTQLSLLSLYIQWLALAGSGTLCLLRPWLGRLDAQRATLASYGLLIGTTLLIAEITYWGGQTLADGAVAVGMSHAEFLGRNLGISAITSFLTLRYFYLRHQLKLNVAAEHQARLQALQARIQPHFLFNSLNTIASLIRHQPRVAETAVEDLADLFRTTLKDSRELVPLATELELARRYLQIEQLRLGERLHVEWNVDQVPQDALLPTLTLQPLLENAIYHGIESLAEGGIIHVHGELKRQQINFSIRNPRANVAQAQHPGHHLALDNIRQRLLAHFEEDAKLETDAGDGYYEVRLLWPYRVSES